MALAVGVDGTLFSGSWDKTIKVWSGTDGTLLQTLHGHTGWVNALTIAPDGGLLSGGDDGMRVWHPQQGGECQVVEKGGMDVEALAVGTGGRVYSSSGSKVLFWK